MAEIIVRRARPFDAGPMVRLLNVVAARENAAAVPMTNDELQDWMALGDVWHLAEQGGEIVGFQWVEAHPDLPPGTCDIATFVDPEAQGIDIGARLFDRTRIAARVAGFTHIHVRVHAQNDGGLIYYQSRGFERLTPVDDPTSSRAPVQHVAMTYRL